MSAIRRGRNTVCRPLDGEGIQYVGHWTGKEYSMLAIGLGRNIVCRPLDGEEIQYVGH